MIIEITTYRDNIPPLTAILNNLNLKFFFPPGKKAKEETKQILARLKIQKLEELKLQIIAQNPQLLGIGLPGPEEEEIGTEEGGPSPMLGGPEQAALPPPEGPPQPRGGTQAAAEGLGPSPGEVPAEGPQQPQAAGLAEPTDEEIKKYDLEIQNYAKDSDHEDVDFSEEG